MHTHTHTTVLRPSWTSSGTTWVSQHQKGKTNLDLLKQETVSGNGISWTICKSAPWPRHITTPASHHSVFYRPDALPAAQPTASKHWRQTSYYAQKLKTFWTWSRQKSAHRIQPSCWEVCVCASGYVCRWEYINELVQQQAANNVIHRQTKTYNNPLPATYTEHGVGHFLAVLQQCSKQCWSSKWNLHEILCEYHTSDWNLSDIQSYSPGGATFTDCFASFSNPVAVTTVARSVVVLMRPYCWLQLIAAIGLVTATWLRRPMTVATMQTDFIHSASAIGIWTVQK